jgi:putative ABC transport system permease protein
VSRFKEWFARLIGTFSPRSRALDDELAFHRQMLIEKLIAEGRSLEESQRLAAIQLGGAAQIADAYGDQQRLPFVDALVQDVRYGLRVLRRTPGFTAAAVLTLALGIGANTAIFTVVDAVLLRPLPFSEPDRLVTVGDRQPNGTSSSVGYLTWADWRERSRSFETFALMRSWQPTLFVNGEAERLAAVRVSWNYFDMMRVRPQLGRTFTADEDRPDHWRVLMLSDGLWRRRFGADPQIVGSTVTMNDREYRVVGVLPPSFEPLDAARFYAAAEIFAPIGYDATVRDACRSCRHLRAFGRLKPGVSIDDATAEMNAIREQQRRENPTQYEEGSIALVPLQRAITGEVRTPLLVLLAAVAFVLLIACANVANLTIARSLVRHRELVLRSVLGAARSRIVRQLLTESAMLTGAGALLGVLLAGLAVRVLTAAAPMSLPRLEHAAVDGRVLLFAALVSVLSGVLFGVAPAFRSGRTGAQQALALDSRTSTGGAARARSLLVVVDLALALVLLAAAGLMLRTVSQLTKADPGFDPDRVLSTQFSLVGQKYAEDPAVLAFQDQFLRRVRGLPGVEAAALAGQIPFGGNFDCRGFHARGRMRANTVDDPCIQTYGVTPDYLRVMRTPLRAGRFFDERDTATGQPVLVVSEATARAVWGDANPIGGEVRIGRAEEGPWRTVIGVVADAHHADVTAPIEGAMYLPETQFTDSFLVAVVRTATGDPASLAAPVRSVLRELDPAVPSYDVATLPALVSAAGAQHVFVMQLLSGFAVVAVLLASIGLYGVVSYTVAQRTREVGIRVALGARPSDVVRLVLSHGALVVVGGLAAGLAAALPATRVLGPLVFGVSPEDPLTFAAAAALLAGVALAAHFVPVRRALRVDPATALRQE